MPEQHLKADLDSGVVHDRHVHGKALRTLDAPLEQASDDGRMAGEACEDAIVQYRQTSELERPPCCWASGQDPAVVGLPRTDQISPAQQFRAGTTPHAHPPQKQALEDEETGPVAQIVSRATPSAELRLDCSPELGVFAQQLAGGLGIPPGKAHRRALGGCGL
jgi:hypothetical protein